MFKARVKGEWVKPVAASQLMSAIGPTKAAKALGVSTTTLYKGRNTDSISRVIEQAAVSELERHRNAPNGKAKPAEEAHDLFIIDIPHSKAEALQRIAAVLGAQLIH